MMQFVATSVTRRVPAQQPATNAAGEIIEVGERIGGGEPGQRTRVGDRTQSHGTPSGAHEIAAGPSGAISFAHAHRLVLGQEMLAASGPAARFGPEARHRANKSAGRIVQDITPGRRLVQNRVMRSLNA